MKAAEVLEQVGIEAEVFDVRVTRPLVTEDIAASVKKTGHLLTADTGFKTLGIGAEIISQVMEKSFSAMKAAPARIGMPDHPTPSSRGYLAGLYPDARKIVEHACDMLKLSADKKAEALKIHDDTSSKLPVDVPDPAFAGPF